MGRVRLLRAADVRAAIDMPACIEACERAFAAYSSGRAELPGVIHLDVPEARGEIHVKAGHLHGEPFYVLKAASGFYGAEPPAIDGLVVVFDGRDGSPAAFLLDGGYLTDLRTGAAGGVAARHLAPEHAERVAVIGTGAQARFQVEALAVERPSVSDISIWGRSTERATSAAAGLRRILGDRCTIAAVPTVRDAVEGAEVILTCTAAREPLVEAGWVSDGSHVTAVGSDGAGKQELDPEILRSADLVVADSIDQCARMGELQHAPDQLARAVELGAICAGSARGRLDAAQRTVCDLTGVGVQDVAAANVVMSALGDSGEIFEL
jgi:ornithine cyclodeaminase